MAIATREGSRARRVRARRRCLDVEDAVQEALMVICDRLGTYRWEGSFAGWVYAVATRSMLRHASASPRQAALALELAEATLLTDHEPMTEAESRLVEQDLHLACAVGVLTGLSPATRRLYLLGEVLAVPDRVGARAVDTTPAAYRKRLLDDLVRLGELHRSHARGRSAEGALRALARTAPTFAG